MHGKLERNEEQGHVETAVAIDLIRNLNFDKFSPRAKNERRRPSPHKSNAKNAWLPDPLAGIR